MYGSVSSPPVFFIAHTSMKRLIEQLTEYIGKISGIVISTQNVTSKDKNHSFLQQLCQYLCNMFKTQRKVMRIQI
jgi:hypothetical protein